MTDPASNVLVTGASGFIGSRLVQRLLEGHAAASKPIQVTALIRQSAATQNPAGFDRDRQSGQRTIHTIKGDLTDPGSLNFGVAGERPPKFDAVYHLAAVTPESRVSRETLRKVNLDGTKHLFDAVRDCAKHFVYVSGSAVFDPGDGKDGSDRIVTEETPKRSDLQYIKMRLEAEEYLRENCAKSGIDFTVVYLPDIVYGNAGSFRKIFLERISQGKFRIPGSGEYLTNFIHLDDAVDILIKVGSMEGRRTSESFVACDSSPAPFREFVNFIADQLGAKHPGSVPLFLAKAAVGSDLIKMLTRNTRASNNKIGALYDFKYPSYRHGIPQVVSQFKASLK